MPYSKKLKQVTVSMFKQHSSADYQLVVEPLYREEATKLLQEVGRLYNKLSSLKAEQMSELAKNPGMLASNKLKQLEQEIAATRQKLQACRKKPFQKLQEPVDDRYLVNLVKHIQAKNYAQIDYSEPEFTRYLFAALRLGKITQDEMLTAKLMYESLIAFNQGKVPENSQAQFSRFNLGDEQGPYDPSQDIPYWTPENSEKLQASNEDKQYYTINLPHQVAVKYLFQCLQDEKISEQLGRYLLAYINSKKCSQQQKDKAIAAVCAFNSSDNDQDVRKRKANYLQQFIRQHESEDVNYFIDNTGYPNMLDEEVPEYISQLADSMFMASFDRLANGMPMLCVSPQQVDGNPASPVLSFVLPTVSTFNNLQSIVHGQDATIPVAVVGPENVRMIRAYDEIPGLANADKSQIQQDLQLLTPTAGRIVKPARPIEVTHPDAKKTDKPHGSDCHDFLLTWHDLFHAWRNGSNYKALIRRLRVLHDEKAGLARDANGMSKVLWKLTDLDISQGKWLRELQKSVALNDLDKDVQRIVYFVGTLFAASNLDYSQEIDDNYLLLYDMTSPENADIWTSLIPVPDMFAHYEKYASALSKYIYVNDFFKKHRKVSEYRKQHPDASIFEIILHDLLTPADFADELLIKYLGQLSAKDLVYWSKNSGLCLNKSVRDKYQGLNGCLRKNRPSQLREFLQAEISENCLVEADLNTLKNEHLRLLMEFKKWSADNAKYAEWLKIDDLSDSQSIFAYTVNNQKIQRFMESINKYKCMLKEYAAVGKLLQVDYVELENSFVNLLNSSVLELGRELDDAVWSFGYDLAQKASDRCKAELDKIKRSFANGDTDQAMSEYITSMLQKVQDLTKLDTDFYKYETSAKLYSEIIQQQSSLATIESLMNKVQTYNRELTFFNFFFILMHLNLWIYARRISQAMSEIPVADRPNVMHLNTEAALKVQKAIKSHADYLNTVNKVFMSADLEPSKLLSESEDILDSESTNRPPICAF